MKKSLSWLYFLILIIAIIAIMNVYMRKPNKKSDCDCCNEKEGFVGSTQSGTQMRQFVHEASRAIRVKQDGFKNDMNIDYYYNKLGRMFK